MKDDDKRMDGVDLAAATGLGIWGIYGIKKANKLFFKQGIDPALIFTGRYCTPAKISTWLDAHPDFVANQSMSGSQLGRSWLGNAAADWQQIEGRTA